LRKIFSISISLVFLINELCAQNLIFWDAQELTKSLDKEKKLNVSETSRYSALPVLKKYFVQNDSSETILQQVRNNPFLKDFIYSGNGISNIKLGLIEPKDFQASKINYNSIQNFPESPQLLAMRFKEDLTIDFFISFKKDFELYPELKVLYPVTNSVIEMTVPDNFYNMFAILRSAFQQDLSNLPLHLQRLRLQSKFSDILKTNEGRQFVFTSSIIAGVQAGNNIADLISSISEEKTIKKDSSNIASAIKFCSLISQSLRDTLAGRIWINHSQFKSMTENETRLKFFLGLLYQENLKLKIHFEEDGKKCFDLQESLVELSQQPKLVSTEFTEYFKSVYSKSTEVENTFDTLKIKIKNKKGIIEEDYKNYAFSIGSFIETTLQINEGFETAIVPFEVKKIANVLSINSLAYQYLGCAKYSNGIFYTMQFLDATLYSNTQNINSRKVIMKYSVFMANIAEARDNESVKLAIESVISSPLATATKTYSEICISVNAYAGLFAGKEILENAKNGFLITGATIPLGIGIYSGLQKTKKVIGCYGIYFSFFDLGTYTSFCLSDKRVNKLPEPNFQNLISPGTSIVLGRLFDTPLSICGGIQISPQARQVYTNPIPFVSSGWRWDVSICYDIPVIYLVKK
jgi:hypothetical protein